MENIHAALHKGATPTANGPTTASEACAGVSPKKNKPTKAEEKTPKPTTKNAKTSNADVSTPAAALRELDEKLVKVKAIK